MKTTKKIKLAVNGLPKELSVQFDYNEIKKGRGILYFKFEGSGWSCWDMIGYSSQEDAIEGFCNDYWGDTLLAIE